MRIILILLPGLLAGCASSDSDHKKLQVAAAFYPLAYAAEEVGDGRLDVRNLTPLGAEPHDLELTPGTVRGVRSADLVLLLGNGFQPQLERAADGDARVVELLDVPRLQLLPNGDPHVWLDPLRYGRIVHRIGALLDAASAADDFVARLHALDDEYRRGLARCARREIVTSHQAFAYLADRYGLRQVAIVGLAPEAEPSPRAVERVIRTVRRTGATTVFFETLVSPRLAETVARETGVRTSVLNPIEGLTDEEAQRGEDYFSLMRANLVSLRRALGCR